MSCGPRTQAAGPTALPMPRMRPLAPTVDPADLSGPLVDAFGRVHQDLRISLTDRCSLRCHYCMPAEGVPWLPNSSLLSTPEIVRVARVAAELGITEMRLTGGEPLLRPDIVEVVRGIAALQTAEGRMRVSITTNGLTLADKLNDLIEAGLERCNVSIDTLQRERYAELTRRDRLDDALAGIRAVRDSGLRPLKLNAVAMRGVNDDELVDLVRFAIEHDASMRFIEQMPLDAGHVWDRAEMVTGEEILAALGAEFDLEPVGERGSAPAELFRIDGGPATVGIIASVTAPFCASCDRLRLTADGQVRNCLFARDELDVRAVLRDASLDEAARDAALAGILHASVGGKKAGHGIDAPGFEQPDRPMSAIGG